MPRPKAILSLNLGSSSLKYAAYDASAEPSAATALCAGNAGVSAGEGYDAVLAELEASVGAVAEPAAIGHRVVFGGERHVEPELIDDRLLQSLEELTVIAPLHLPPEIAAIRATARRFPQTPQFACFDTAFHAAIPDIAKRIPIDRNLWPQGI